MPLCPRCGEENPARARFCLVCGTALDAPGHEGERKVATVLFADLVGSTELGGAQDPERTRAVMDRFYDAMAAEIETAGGTVEKFAGDAVMAAFGVPQAHEDDAERALHAALSMRRRLDELFGDTLSLRIGVNTGEVVVGRPREGSSFVTGDVVNVAARLEQAAAAGEILAGERTVAAARGAFEFGEPMTVEAKGKPAGVAGRRIVRALSLMRSRGVGGLRRAFVGRERELGLLQAAYRELDGARPRLVTIVGEPGVGKTRLVREAWEWLAGETPEPLRRTGRCLSYGQGITYWPLAEVLKEHFGILESDPPASVLRRLEGREILGLTLGLDVAGGPPPPHRPRPSARRLGRLHEQSRRRAACRGARGGHPLGRAGAARPARATRARCEWAAAARRDCASGAARHSPGVGRRAACSLDHSSSSRSLPRRRRMLDELLGRRASGLRARRHRGARRGEPVLRRGAARDADRPGCPRARRRTLASGRAPAGFAVPDSVQAVLAARMDLLAPPRRRPFRRPP